MKVNLRSHIRTFRGNIKHRWQAFLKEYNLIPGAHYDSFVSDFGASWHKALGIEPDESPEITEQKET